MVFEVWVDVYPGVLRSESRSVEVSPWLQGLGAWWV